jgi:hypothetical protein
MRVTSTVLASTFAAAIFALPQQATTLQVSPNVVDVMGGDFGLLPPPSNNTSPLFSAIGSFLGSVQSGLMTFIFGKDADMSSIMAKISGSNSTDINAMVCTTFDPKSQFYAALSAYAGVPARPSETCGRDLSGGSGPYKANLTEDTSYPNHTIYAPIVPPPADIKLPVLIWGGCVGAGSMFANFLTEIASYGFIAIATGPPVGLSRATTVSDITRNIDWVTTSPAAKKYGNVDTSKLVVAGQSCGGLEAMSGSYKDPRVKMTLMFNSGITDPAKKPKLKELQAAVAYFLGGPTDIAYPNVGENSLLACPRANKKAGNERLRPYAIKYPQLSRFN